MSQYCRYYGIVASPLHSRLTRVTEPFPKQWLPGTDYDIAFHRIKSMMLDESLFLWNKDSAKRLFIEVDACNEGRGVSDDGTVRLEACEKEGQPVHHKDQDPSTVQPYKGSVRSL